MVLQLRRLHRVPRGPVRAGGVHRPTDLGILRRGADRGRIDRDPAPPARASSWTSAGRGFLIVERPPLRCRARSMTPHSRGAGSIDPDPVQGKSPRAPAWPGSLAVVSRSAPATDWGCSPAKRFERVDLAGGDVEPPAGRRSGGRSRARAGRWPANQTSPARVGDDGAEARRALKSRGCCRGWRPAARSGGGTTASFSSDVM